MARRKRRSSFLTTLIVILIIAALIYFLYTNKDKILDGSFFDDLFGDSADNNAPIVNGKVQIHFLELGNKYTGDCTYIKVGDIDILIDAGSRKGSAAVISEYINQYVTDGKLEYVIATHAHQDHIAGFAKRDGSIFDLYECETVIDFALTNSTTATYNDYIAERDAEIANGAKHYTAAELRQQDKHQIALGEDVTLTVLDNRFYYEKTSDENDYSVCVLLTEGQNNYLFTGDLEEDGEASLIQLNDLPKVNLFKGAHHGSYTASSEQLLQVIEPEMVCVCCCAGSTEYTDNMKHVFPAQEFCDRIAPYTDKVYVTTMVDEEDNFMSMNGNIVVASTDDGIVVQCSNNNTVLKDTEWFKKYRTCPAAWR